MGNIRSAYNLYFTQRYIKINNMSINDITKKIISDAEEECEKIKKHTVVIIKKIKKDTEEKKKHLHKENEDTIQTKLKKSTEKTLSTAKQQAVMEKEKILRREVDSVFQNTYQQLLSLDSDNYIKLLSKLIKHSSIKKDFLGTCYYPANRKTETEKILSFLDIKTQSIKKTEEHFFKAGLKLENKKEYYDFSFENLIMNIKTKKEDKIFEILSKK